MDALWLLGLLPVLLVLYWYFWWPQDSAEVDRLKHLTPEEAQRERDESAW